MKIREFIQNIESIEGGDQMSLMDDPRMKAFLKLGDEIMTGKQSKSFSEETNPGEALHKKTMDILLSQECFTEDEGSENKKMDYVTAFNEACVQNPNLAARYIEQLEEVRKNNMTSTLFRRG